MGAPYTSVTVASYNLNPPPDDGSQSPQNQVVWATTKTKLADPIKTAVEAVNTNIPLALAKLVGGGGITETSTDYEIQASNQGGLVVCDTASRTITTPDATDVDEPFVVAVVNTSSGSITLEGSGAQTIDGATSITIPAGNGVNLHTDGTNWFTDGQNFTRSFPPVSSFKNLSIKVASNTTVTVAADAVTTSDGSRYQTTAVSGTINLGTFGAANALDAGTIAQATWYAIWVIAKADGTTAALASTSGSSPTLPSGYTYAARIGWVRTAAGAAQLMGTWQYGRKAQYKLGLAQTSILPLVTGGIGGTVGTYSETAPTYSAISVSNFVPTTATEITVIACSNYNNDTLAAVQVAPTTSYAGHASTKPPPFDNKNGTSAGSHDVTMLLEASTIAVTCNSGGGAIQCLGWEDNI